MLQENKSKRKKMRTSKSGSGSSEIRRCGANGSYGIVLSGRAFLILFSVVDRPVP